MPVMSPQDPFDALLRAFVATLIITVCVSALLVLARAETKPGGISPWPRNPAAWSTFTA
jgi:hypothetical protein